MNSVENELSVTNTYLRSISKSLESIDKTLKDTSVNDNLSWIGGNIGQLKKVIEKLNGKK